MWPWSHIKASMWVRTQQRGHMSWRKTSQDPAQRPHKWGRQCAVATSRHRAQKRTASADRPSSDNPTKQPPRHVLCSCSISTLTSEHSVIWTGSVLCCLHTRPLQSPEWRKDPEGSSDYWLQSKSHGIGHPNCNIIPPRNTSIVRYQEGQTTSSHRAGKQNWASQVVSLAPMARPWRLTCFPVWPFLHNLACLSCKLVKGFAKIHITLTHTHLFHRVTWNLSECFYFQIECMALWYTPPPIYFVYLKVHVGHS